VHEVEATADDGENVPHTFQPCCRFRDVTVADDEDLGKTILEI
jgi:hypothetical protein